MVVTDDRQSENLSITIMMLRFPIDRKRAPYQDFI